MIKQVGLPLRSRPILLITPMITDRTGLHSVLLPLLIILVIKQIRLPLCGRPILLITRMITNRIGLHSVLLPLLIIILLGILLLLLLLLEMVTGLSGVQFGL